MEKSKVLWIVAVVVTLASASYQRLTGPTYPIRGSEIVDGQKVKFKLARTHGGNDNHRVDVTAPAPLQAALEWKRFKTQDSWTAVPMVRQTGSEADILSAELPGQPPAGKLEYRIRLVTPASTVVLPEDRTVVIRFKGAVPLFILIPHVIAMFTAMLLACRTALELFKKQDRNLKKLTLWTIGALTVGGLILGPLVQLYAFGALWTGFPYGTDLTDNKTAIAFIGWLVALFAVLKTRKPEKWVLAASILTFAVYLVPHSMFGSELDYNKLDQNGANAAGNPPHGWR